MKTQKSEPCCVKETIFLTRKEALEAIRIDFQQYAPQIKIWKDISLMVFREDTRLVEEVSKNRLWLLSNRKRRMRPISEAELGRLLVRELERSDPPLNHLASICCRVFQAKVRPGPSQDGHKLGLHVETGMEDFKCKKCGRCCRALDYHDQLTEQDYWNWLETGRKDLIEWVRPVRKSNHKTTYRIWVPPGTLKVSSVCPWLRPVKEEKAWLCAIHDVKPEICRQYPGTRKHAIMTGCPGFE